MLKGPRHSRQKYDRFVGKRVGLKDAKPIGPFSCQRFSKKDNLLSFLNGASSANCASYIAIWDEKVVRVRSMSVLDLLLERHRTERYLLAILDEVWCSGGHCRFYPHDCGFYGWKGEKKLPCSATFPPATSGSRDRPSTFRRTHMAFSLPFLLRTVAHTSGCVCTTPSCSLFLSG